MASSSLYQSAGVDLECSICTNVFKDPRFLPCLHTFCLNCLKKYVDIKFKNNESVTCPLCRADVEIPKDGVSGFENNSFLQALIKTGEKQQEGSCDNCTRQNTVFNSYCSDCPMKLCFKCVKSHQITKRFAYHKLVEKNLLSRSQLEEILRKVAVYCNVHKSERITLHCSTCKQLICVVCRGGRHSNHTCLDLEEATEKFHKQLQPKLEKIKRNLEPFNKAVTTVDKELRKAENQIENLIKEVEQTTQQMINKLMDDSEKLKEELRQTKKQLCQEQLQIKEEIQLSVTKFESFLKFVDDLNSFGSDIDVINMSDKLSVRAEDLLRLSLPDIKDVDNVAIEKKKSEQFLLDNNNAMGRILRQRTPA